MSASGKFLDYDGLIHFFNSKIKPNYTTLTTNQTISGIKTIKNQLKVQYGSSGGIVLGADRSGTTLTNETAKIGSIVSPMFLNINKTFTVLQSDAEGDVNVVSIGGTSAGTNPTVFNVKLDNSIGGSKTRDVLLATYDAVSIGTNTINLLSPNEGDVTFSRGASSLSFKSYSLVFTGVGFTYSNGDDDELTIGPAGSRTVIPSANPEDESPVWELGSSARRFKRIHVDELCSNVNGYDTSIKAIFSPWGPGYLTDHITTGTLSLDGHNNENSPAISLNNLGLFYVPDEASYYGNPELNISGDILAKNVRAESSIESDYIYAKGEVGASVVCISGEDTDHFLSAESDAVADNVFEYVNLNSSGGLRVNKLHSDSLHLINTEDDSSFYLYAQTDVDDPLSGNSLFIEDASLSVDGVIKEGGTLLEDKYALKDEIGMPNSSINAPFTVQPFMGATRGMRLFALPTDQIIVEQSVDGGATWSSANVENWTKEQLFSQTRLGSISIPLKSGKKSCSCMVRVTITGMKYNVPAATVETQKYNYWDSNYVASNERYCTLDFGYFWISANADKMYIEHQVSTGAYPNDWIVDGSLNSAQGWPGGNYVKFSGKVLGGATDQVYNCWNHRFIFRTQASDGSFDDSKLNQDYLTTQQRISEISCYGQNCWTAANEMMKSDRPYTVNNSNQTTFTGDVIVQGAMYPQGDVLPQSNVYAQASVYAKGGFVFTGQSDADKKLLRADGGWQHIDTIRNPYTKYNLYNTDKYTQVINGNTTIITLNEQFGYYYIDLAMLQFPDITESANATVIIKSNYPNTKCVVYCDRYAQSYNIICMQVYAQYGYVFPTTNDITDASISTLCNNEYDLANNYVEYEYHDLRSSKFLIEWTEHGDCKVMPTLEM